MHMRVIRHRQYVVSEKAGAFRSESLRELIDADPSDPACEATDPCGLFHVLISCRDHSLSFLRVSSAACSSHASFFALSLGGVRPRGPVTTLCLQVHRTRVRFGGKLILSVCIPTVIEKLA
jgi:hypothetical protein